MLISLAVLCYANVEVKQIATHLPEMLIILSSLLLFCSCHMLP